MYDIEQGVADGSTVRIYYESRLAKINIKEEERPKIDEAFEEITENEEISEKQKLNPAPNKIFRWCTERLKINPTTHFILELTKQKGEVILLLGSRKNESSKRSASIKKYEVEGQRLRKHELPNSYVYTPIKDVLTDDLWKYLNQVSNPWGSSNKELITLYKNANSGDCPLVIDKTSPSCGNSRFGCWVCTVVDRDKSMEALIENGEDWMEPLMELRDLLSISRDRKDMREERKRDGTIKEGQMGPYTPAFRAEFLEKLFKAQKEIQRTNPEIVLISYQEMVGIQVQWFRDGIFNHSVADIYNKIYNANITLELDDEKTVKEKDLLKEI